MQLRTWRAASSQIPSKQVMVEPMPPQKPSPLLHSFSTEL
jgi:hypothetical protein